MGSIKEYRATNELNHTRYDEFFDNLPQIIEQVASPADRLPHHL